MPKKEDITILKEFMMQIDDLFSIEDMLSQFNFFETIKYETKEHMHSNIIAWLCDPKKNHGLNTMFLNKLIKKTLSLQDNYTIDKFGIEDLIELDYSNTSVRREWNKIDILVIIRSTTKSLFIAIENKIKAKESRHQLSSYSDKIDEMMKKLDMENASKIKIFLTRDNKDPSDESWIALSYDDIAEIIDCILSYSTNTKSNQVLDFLQNYNAIIRRHVMDNTEVRDMCSIIYKKHKAALDLIFENRVDVIGEMIPKLVDMIQQTDGILIVSQTRSYLRFTTPAIRAKFPLIEEKNPDQNLYYAMYAIDFGNDRIPLKLIIYPGNQDTRIRIKDFFVEKQPIFKVAKNKFSNYYHSVYSTDIVSRSDFDKIDPEKDRSFTLLPDLEEIVKASWDKFVKIDYLKIEEYINSSRINE